VQAGKAAAAKLAGQMDDSKAWVTQITDLVATANDQADAAHHEYNNLPSGQPDESLLVKTGQFLTGPVIGSVWSQMDRQDAAQARIDAAKAAVDKIATNIADTTRTLDLTLRYPPTIGSKSSSKDTGIDGLVPVPPAPTPPTPVPPTPHHYQHVTGTGSTSDPSGGAGPAGGDPTPAVAGATPGGYVPAASWTPAGGAPGAGAGGPGGDLSVDGSLLGKVPGYEPGPAVDWTTGGATRGLAGTSAGDGLAGGLIGGSAVPVGCARTRVRSASIGSCPPVRPRVRPSAARVGAGRGVVSTTGPRPSCPPRCGPGVRRAAARRARATGRPVWTVAGVSDAEVGCTGKAGRATGV